MILTDGEFLGFTEADLTRTDSRREWEMEVTGVAIIKAVIVIPPTPIMDTTCRILPGMVDRLQCVCLPKQCW